MHLTALENLDSVHRWHCHNCWGKMETVTKRLYWEKKTVVIDKLIANKRKFGDAFSFKLSPLNTKEFKRQQTTALCFVQGICSLNNQFFYSFRCHTKITAASIKKKPKSAWFVTHCKVQKKKYKNAKRATARDFLLQSFPPFFQSNLN